MPGSGREGTSKEGGIEPAKRGGAALLDRRGGRRRFRPIGSGGHPARLSVRAASGGRVQHPRDRRGHDAARAEAQLRLPAIVHELSSAHRCKGGCVGVAILRWPEASSVDVIISATKGPTGDFRYRAFHGGNVSAWITCENLPQATRTALLQDPGVGDVGDIVGWRLLPPGTTIA